MLPAFNARAVEWLVAQGASELGEVGSPFPLHCAAQCGRARCADELLAAGAAERIDARDGAGRTALWSAVAEDQLVTAQLLHAWGAALEARSATGATPLHAAAARGSAHGVQLLLCLGADPRRRRSARAPSRRCQISTAQRRLCGATEERIADGGGNFERSRGGKDHSALNYYSSRLLAPHSLLQILYNVTRSVPTGFF